MAHVGDLQLHEGIFISVFPLDGILGFHGGFAQERIVVGDVLENDETVILGMDFFLHD
jgi:hypothetical protein